MYGCDADLFIDKQQFIYIYIYIYTKIIQICTIINRLYEPG